MKTKQLSIHVPVDMYKRLQLESKQQDRSITSLVRVILEGHIEEAKNV